MRLATLMLFLSVICMPTYAAENLPDQLKAAEEAYDRGDFEAARQLYLRVVETGHLNGHVYFDLGNSLYRSGQKAEALAAYLKARELLPRDPDIRANLAFVHKNAEDALSVDVDSSSPLRFVPALSQVTARELIFAFCMIFGAGFILLSVGALLRKQRIDGLKVAGFGFLAVGLLILPLGVIKTVQANEYSWAVVKSESAPVYSGPSRAANQVMFELHALAPGLSVDEQPGWIKIKISDGKTGWVEKSHVAMF